MLNVYNYYLQDYVSRSPRYSTHKKRELRDIYKNIVKMSASEPLYKIDLSESKQACALSIKESALALKDVNHTLQDTPLLHNAGIYSENADAVQASLLHRMELSEFPENARYDIEVAALASGQRNVGFLLPAEKTPLPEGSYSFTVAFDLEQYSFRFNVAADSSAFDLQSKLADFINKTGIGLEAQVAYHKETGISRLELSAKQTGIYGKSSFSVTDTGKPEDAKAGLAEVFGLNHMSVSAQNARYSVNGVSYESPDNTISYQDTLLLNLRSVTDSPVTVRPIPDRSAVYDALEEFTVSYNRLVQAGKSTIQENRSSALLLRGLSHLVASHYSSLSSIGITSDEEGYLTLDPEKVNQAAVSGDAEAVLRKDFSFLKALDSRLESIILNPMRYVDKKLVAYPDPRTPIGERTSPYTTSIYSGMLFNNYC
mgnify:CR=1 FL=1